MTKKRKVIWIISLIVAIIVAWNIIITLLGTTEEGVAANLAEVPYVGKYLSDFETTGNIKYVYSVNNFRGSYGIITGTSSLKALEKFMSKDENWHNPGSADIEECWLMRWKEFGKSFDEFPIGNSVEDPYLTNSFKKDGRAIQIELAYRLSDNKFSIYFMNTFAEEVH